MINWRRHLDRCIFLHWSSKITTKQQQQQKQLCAERTIKIANQTKFFAVCTTKLVSTYSLEIIVDALNMRLLFTVHIIILDTNAHIHNEYKQIQTNKQTNKNWRAQFFLRHSIGVCLCWWLTEGKGSSMSSTHQILFTACRTRSFCSFCLFVCSVVAFFLPPWRSWFVAYDW